MAYELFLLPVAPGADLEEAGEALLALLADEIEVPGAPPEDLSPLLSAMRSADPSLGPAPERAPPGSGRRVRVPVAGDDRSVPVADFRASAGIDVTVARTFARFRVPFHHRGEDAEAVFDRLFRLLAAAARATDWLAYDPQEAQGVPLDDAGRDTVLELYLTVMDQLRPAAAG